MRGLAAVAERAGCCVLQLCCDSMQTRLAPRNQGHGLAGEHDVQIKFTVITLGLGIRQASSGSRLWHAASPAVQRTSQPARLGLLGVFGGAAFSSIAARDAGSGPLRRRGFRLWPRHIRAFCREGMAPSPGDGFFIDQSPLGGFAACSETLALGLGVS